MGRRLNQPGRGGEEGERRPVVKGSRATAKGPGGAQENRIKDQDRGLAKMLCTPCSSLLQCETHSRAIPSIGTFDPVLQWSVATPVTPSASGGRKSLGQGLKRLFLREICKELLGENC